MGDVLPLAVGVALSPVPIIAVVLMLATPRGRANGVAFAVGWVCGLVAVCVIVLVLANGADRSTSTASTLVDWMKLALGVALVVLAGRRWRTRPAPGAETALPEWMARVDRFDVGRSLALGVALAAVNPKNLALTAAAAGSIAQAGGSTTDAVVAVCVFVVLASSTILGPVLLSLFSGERAARALTGWREFMSDHDNVIMMVVLLVLGAKLIGSGVAGLGG